MRPDIRRKYTCPDREGFPNIARFNKVTSRHRRMSERSLRGRYVLLCMDLGDFLFRNFHLYRVLYLKSEARKAFKRLSKFYGADVESRRKK